MKQTHIRSIAKGIVWRCIATITTTVIAYIITGEPLIAVEIGLAEMGIKILIYYIHERVWLRIKWGTINE
ncbi:MAG: DUF2061 domain-containing protein [Bacteroidota bacterium]